MASTAPGPSRSTPSLTLLIRPPPWIWPAARMIAQVRPTSASTTAATSCGGAPRFTCSRACSRPSARAGWRSASSKAAARTRPRPSPRVPFCVPRAEVAAVAMGDTSARLSRLFSPCVDLPRTCVAALRRKPLHGSLDPVHGLVLAQHRERLEDPRRDRRPSDRHPDRLVELAGLHVVLGEDPPQRGLQLLGLEGLGATERIECVAEQRKRAVLHHLLPRLLVGLRLLEDEVDQRPDLLERLGLLLGDLAGGAQALVGLAAEVPGHHLRVVIEVHLAHEAAVQPAQLLLVEDRAGPAHVGDVEALNQLRGAHDRRVVLGAPAEQRQVVAYGGGQIAVVSQLLHAGGAVALGELLAVRAVQQRQVGVARLLHVERLHHHQLLWRIGKVVVAADHVRDPHIRVVYRYREVVENGAIASGDHEVILDAIVETDVAPNFVVDDCDAVWDLEPNGSTLRPRR